MDGRVVGQEGHLKKKQEFKIRKLRKNKNNKAFLYLRPPVAGQAVQLVEQALAKDLEGTRAYFFSKTCGGNEIVKKIRFPW